MLIESSMMREKINEIKRDFLSKIQAAKNLRELDGIFLEAFGKNGEITQFSHGFKNVSKDELKTLVPLFNQVKAGVEKGISEKREEIREAGYAKLVDEKLNLEIATSAGQRTRNDDSNNGANRKGRLHPLTQFENEIAKLFSNLGFQQFDAPQIDSDYYNFQVLNIPENHPARDLQDTLYIDPHNIGPQPHKLLLRTHTSNSQIRIMKKYKLPIRIMNIGRAFRYENLDARHEHTFDQFELVYIDKGLSMANLQYLSEYFFKEVFGPEIKARLRPKYYPFVEPGAGVDGLCMFCKGKGCRVCGNLGWLELAGAGMIHPQVLKNGGIDPEEYSGIAWGVGPERMVMLKEGIEDIRLFKSGDLKFLKGGKP